MTKGRREDYKKGGEHSRQLVNLILCELLYGLKGKQTWGRHSDWTWTLILFAFATLQTCPATNIRPDANEAPRRQT